MPPHTLIFTTADMQLLSAFGNNREVTKSEFRSRLATIRLVCGADAVSGSPLNLPQTTEEKGRNGSGMDGDL